MSKAVKLTGAASAFAFAIFIACSGDQTTNVADLRMTVSQRTIDAQGQTTQIGIQATNSSGGPGQGQVVLSATAGFFDSTLLTLGADGRASANFRCDQTADSRCSGSNVRITATWTPPVGAALTANTNISVLVYVPDAGPPDSGVPTDAGTDAGTDGGTDGGVDAGFSALSLVAFKSTIFRGVGDFSVITASLQYPDGGPWSGQTITFSTNLGGFQVGDGGNTAASTSGVTDGGTTTANFTETGDAGVATITGVHQASGSTANVNVTITAVQQIIWVSTNCGGQSCTIMGLRGSGFNEQAQVTFKVLNSSAVPLAGVPVTFSLTHPPTGTTVGPSGVTDANGLVTTTASAGGVIGTFTVQAVVVPNQIQTQSPNIGLRGAKPTNYGFQLRCTPYNVATYVEVQPPADLTVTCNVTLRDRFTNSIGTGTSVNFKAEAGTITAAVNTKAYPDPAEGTANVNFYTRGAFPPLDTDPLPAVPGQWPIARQAEPSITVGSLVRNPRDGFVTIIAYLRGEEFFDDNNQNGRWDPGERFYDQGEAFVDANDNGVWDPGEFYIDDSPPNGVYDGPNGTWDGDTTVWTEARVLYTGRPIGDASHVSLSPNPFAPLCPGGIPKGGYQNVTTQFGDLNLNRPIAGSSITGAVTPRGTVVGGGNLEDGFGFGFDRIWVDASNPVHVPPACTATSYRCVTQLNFSSWGAGTLIPITVFGMPFGDTSTCGNSQLTVTTTVLNISLSTLANGGIQ